MIILWLSKEQFPSMDSVPLNLRNMAARGLQIRLVDDDLRSHKKYIYAMQEFPEDYIITLDDDIFYNSQIIKDLISAHDKYPGTITGNRAWQIKIENGDIAPYTEWTILKNETAPSYNILPTGVGGILYPPNSLYPDVFNIELIKKLCFQADDIWLNAMAYLNETKYVKTEPYTMFYLPIMFANNINLSTTNVTQGENDKQIKKLRDYYIQNRGVDPYKKLFS